MMFGLSSRKTPSRRTFNAPPGARIYVVGDIHGRADLLRKLLTQIETDAAAAPGQDRQLIFLGDYVDRGYYSREVIEILRAGLPDGLTRFFLRGNHEEIMLRFLDGDLSIANNWFVYGGRETIASYGLPPPPQGKVTPPALQKIHEEFSSQIPENHVDFLRSTQLYHQSGDYIFVHAGLRPGLPLALQAREDLLYIRNEFLHSDEDFGGCVVHGHTVSAAPVVRHNRIGIDTGAYATAKLTCLILEGSEYRFLQT